MLKHLKGDFAQYNTLLSHMSKPKKFSSFRLKNKVQQDKIHTHPVIYTKRSI